MSTAHAIGAVTKVLVNLVDQGMKAANLSGVVGSVVDVTAVSPKRVDLSNSDDPNQLNIFLYLALPNHGGSGFDLPTRDSSGARIKNTPLALDLYYLLTAYGKGNFSPEIILGHAMQVLHENPILPRDTLRAKLKPSATPTTAEIALADSGIADQLEQLKVSPEKMTTEEISRLWSAIGAEYRPTAAYRVTVVLIEARVSTKTALPVLERGVYVRTLRSPLIERVLSKSDVDEAASDTDPILPGYILILSGKRLKGELTRVAIDGVKLDALAAFVSDESVGLALPTTLRAGPHGAQIVHDVAMGSPAVPHTGAESNVVLFQLRPKITAAVTATATNITIKLNPPVTPTQRVRVLLNELNPPADRAARAYSFTAPQGNGIDVAAGDTETATVKVPYKDVVTGAYLVRAQVDGADSVLETDGTGAFFKPKVNIP
jgi:hypothetical protein